MLQLTQKLKTGGMQVQEVSPPVMGPGMVLVRNHFSLISAGTEGATVKTARKNLVAKAKERPQQAKQVLDVLQKQGPVQTYRAVMKKLDAYSPLGYSSAGEVLQVGEGVTTFCRGDRVACAGAGYANHAEVVAVPSNLCVKLQPNADLGAACYNTLGAIALQGVRQADLRIGETCAVVGLGLLGHVTGQILRAGGIRTVGIDVSSSAARTAGECGGIDLALERDATNAERIRAFTDGLGVDAVIITAGTDSLDPVNFAGEIARKKGRVVIVGNVPTGFDREPHFYRKELELRMSCSYGPGRYDLAYEELGVEYPAAYVRWTENRNMAAFQDLVQAGRINVGSLTTHTIPFADAPKAYDMIVTQAEPFLGIVLQYDTEKPFVREPLTVSPPRPAGVIGISFVGAGSYAQGNLLPNIPSGDGHKIRRRGVLTRSGTTSKRVAERFGFEFCTSDESDVLEDADTNTVFIATRHDSHAPYVIKALKSALNVFVEKPLCLNADELDTILSCLEATAVAPLLMVGFNRRFAPLSQLLKEKVAPSGPVSMLYRVNAGAVPADNWIQEPELGGGRIIGEACHFVDFLTYVCGALPTRVHATALPDPDGLQDTTCINLEFANGSIGTIAYFANGSKRQEKEYVEIHGAGQTGVLRDFRQLEILGGRKRFKKRGVNQDKGQRVMVEQFLDAVKEGHPSPISLAELTAVTRATFAAVESIRTGQAIIVDGTLSMARKLVLPHP